MKRLHRQSLLHIPLLRQAFNDKRVKFAPRRMDRDWMDVPGIPVVSIGFNPLHKTIFYPAKSATAAWLKEPETSARKHNAYDDLVNDVVVMIHDYMHIWAYLTIRHLVPKMGFGTAPITKKNIEDFVFLHLVTEAVAVVGLDYWYLSCVDLNHVCDLGTNFKNFAINYREEQLPELRRLKPNFTPQRVEFFGEICDFYMTAEFSGFDFRSILKCPIAMNWLKHELSYADDQKKQVRRWFSYMSQDGFKYSEDDLNQPVEHSAKWKKQLVREMGRLLWEKVKEDQLHDFGDNLRGKQVWSRRPDVDLDFRFVNIESLRENELEDRTRWTREQGNFDYLFAQYLRSFDQESFPDELRKLFGDLTVKRDFALVRYLFRNEKRVKCPNHAPSDLFNLA